MKRKGGWLAVVIGLTVMPATVQAKDSEERLEGYAEWRLDTCLVVDAQRVCPSGGMRFKGRGAAQDFGSIPLGYEVKVKGVRAADGALLASEVEARPNGSALFEAELRHDFDAIEELFRRRGRVFDEDDRGVVTQDYGRLLEHGSDVRRVRRILDDLVPPYLDPEDFRVYVVDNDEWNALAAPNGALFVFTGLLDDMDDDEVAIVLGHELAHATHEHARRQVKKDTWIQLATAGVVAVAEETIDSKGPRVVAQAMALLGGLAWSNGYGRGLEDQADRVGLRYAYEAGYDVSRAPRLWRRFAERYGSLPKAVHFFLDDHSRSQARAAKLEREIRLNYGQPVVPSVRATHQLREEPYSTPSLTLNSR